MKESHVERRSFRIFFLCSIMIVLAAFAGIIGIYNVTKTGADDFVPPDNVTLVSKVDTRIATDIDESRIALTKADGNQVSTYVLNVNMTSNVSILAGYKDMDPSVGWGMQTVRGQATSAITQGKGNVVAAVNADFYNMSTGRPTGALIMNGTVYQDTTSAPFFGITYDGEAVIGDLAKYNDIKSDLKEAVSGGPWLVTDGVANTFADPALYPRTCVGVKEDGSVIAFTCDGRNYPYSVGMTFNEAAEMMKSLGAYNALNLDGGGSTTFVSKPAGYSDLLVRNVPSDGPERKVSSSILFVSNVTPSGVFSSAVVEPNGEVYMPGASVQLTAKGVDSAGAPVALPSDLAWELDANSQKFGTIDQNGLFVSNGTLCDGDEKVTVAVTSGGRQVGSAEIYIDQPTSFEFLNPEISVGFEKMSDMGLLVLSKGRNINYGDDFNWTITLDAGYSDLNPSDLGTITDNILYTADGLTVEGTITVSYSYVDALGSPVVISSSLHVIVGQKPTTVWDFEDIYDDFGTLVKTAQEEYTFDTVGFNANGGVMLKETDTNANYYVGHYYNDITSSRGALVGASLADRNSGEIKRGNYSLKVDFDFTTLYGIEGACVGAGQPLTIPGSPSAVGVWVYATPECKGYWLRLRCVDGNDAAITTVFKDPVTGKDYGNGNGIDFVGWKYVTVDLSAYVAPIKLNAGEVLRLMYVGTASNPAVEAFKGSIYYDDFQFIYGADTSDKVNPVVNSFTVSDAGGNLVKENVAGQTVYSNDLMFDFEYEDDNEKYRSGIKNSATKVYIDGIDMTAEAFNTTTDTQQTGDIHLSVKLPNGRHSITLMVYDDYDNVTEVTRYITVEAETDGVADTSVWVECEDIKQGQPFSLKIMTSQIENIDEISTTMEIGGDFTSFQIIPQAGFSIVTANWNASRQILTLTVARVDSDATGEAVLADIIFEENLSALSGAAFSYGISRGEITYANDFDCVGGFALDMQTQRVIADLNLDIGIFIVGQEGEVYVTGNDGKPVEGATIYYFDGATDHIMGTTDADGRLSISSFQGVMNFSLYAKKGSAYSFIKSSVCAEAVGSNDGTPFMVSFNAVADSSSMQSITWFANPLAVDDEAYIQYATDTDYNSRGEAAFETVSADWINYMFNTGTASTSYAVRINSVTLTSLYDGVTYMFRVGDGTVWSDVGTFKTILKNSSVDFFVLGDLQDDMSTDYTVGSLGRIGSIIEELANQGTFNAQFGIQVGDFVESPYIYEYWDHHLGAFSNSYLGTVDIIHLMGNHEGYSIGGGTPYEEAQLIFNVPVSYTSYVYGNVYVAIINFNTDSDDLQEAFEWLADDAQKSDALWKILVMHQPTYYTNAAAELDSKYVNENLPYYAQLGGIHVVFSGHDHAYARTKPLTDGEVDNAHGIYYVMVGVVGSKRYAPTINPDFHFDTVASGDEFRSIYLTLSATDKYLTINAFNEVNAIDNGSYQSILVDSFTINAKYSCYGTSAVDSHTYCRDVDYYGNYIFICAECGHQTYDITDYHGFVTDIATGKMMYYNAGNSIIGTLILGPLDVFYFDDDGLGYNGFVTLRAVDGVMRTKYCIDGVVQVGFLNLNGNWYYLQDDDTNAWRRGTMRRAETYAITVNGITTDYIFNSNGTLASGWLPLEDGTLTYFNPNAVSASNTLKNVSSTSAQREQAYQTLSGLINKFSSNSAFASLESYFTRDYFTFEYTFYDEDGTTVLKNAQVAYGTVITPPTSPTKDSTAEYNYHFTGWLNYSDGMTVNGNMIFIAQYTSRLIYCTVTFYDEDGTTVLWTATVDYGTMLFSLSDPVKPSTAQYTYTFDGWDPTFTNGMVITDHQSFTATYTSTVNKYAYTFYDEDGTTVLKTATVDYGTVITPPTSPEKDSTAQFDYAFSGWSNYTEGMTVSGDVSFVAKYTPTVKKYTVTFYDEDGTTVLWTKAMDYGSALYAMSDPVKPSTAQYAYAFDGWDPAYTDGMTVTANHSFKAKYSSVVNKYTYTFYDEDGTTVLKTATVDYGTVITPPTSPEKDSTDYLDYTFSGWSNYTEGMTVDGDISFVAKYTVSATSISCNSTIVSLPSIMFITLLVGIFAIVLLKKPSKTKR